MCAVCGCSEISQASHEQHEREHRHQEHHHHEQHDHRPLHSHTGRVVALEEQILAKNDARAAANRAWLTARKIVAINLMSSPGAGKTTLLERTLKEIAARHLVAVIEGDQETSRDADRLRAVGAPTLQINTRAGCHLDAEMVTRALDELQPTPGSLLFIENVGNLVCPALFDLGERARVVVASVTEGEDKPLKYPYMFRAASAVILNKFDLLPYVRFEVARFREHLQMVNPTATLISTSAVRSDGLDVWYTWLESVATAAVTTFSPSERI
jgi:hydrogenase nickel incorporation protein HypB